MRYARQLIASVGKTSSTVTIRHSPGWSEEGVHHCEEGVHHCEEAQRAARREQAAWTGRGYTTVRMVKRSELVLTLVGSGSDAMADQWDLRRSAACRVRRAVHSLRMQREEPVVASYAPHQGGDFDRAEVWRAAPSLQTQPEEPVVA